jgi:AcrR family transcriptional regulator
MPALPMAEIRALYEARSMSVADVAERAGVAVPTLMRWVTVHGWARRRRGRPPAAPVSPPVRLADEHPREPDPATPAGRRRLVARIWAAADAQMADVERRMRAAGEGGADERDARITAVLVRTVRDLVALDGELQGEAAKDDERQTSVTPDGLRDELVRRLEARLRDG